MSKELEWMNDLRLTEEQFEAITDEIQAVIEKHNERTTYSVVESAIRNYGRSISEAKKIIGICCAKGMFLETIESWTHLPQEIKHYIRQLEKEDKE